MKEGSGEKNEKMGDEGCGERRGRTEARDRVRAGERAAPTRNEEEKEGWEVELQGKVKRWTINSAILSLFSDTDIIISKLNKIKCLI